MVRWRHHAFLADVTNPALEIDKFHRPYAGVELAIRDLKGGAGLQHVPSGNPHANSVCFAMLRPRTHSMRWTTIWGDVRVGSN